MPVSAILLAAGRSERMGEQKALLAFDGRTLIDYQLEQLSAREDISEIIVVTGDRAQALTVHIARAPRARAVHNQQFDSGKVSSIRCGLDAVAADMGAILLLSVDQPRPAAIICELLERHTAAGALITMPVHKGHGGHPVIFDASLLAELRAIEEASLGVRAVIDRHTTAVNRVAFDDPIVGVDVNTREDLDRARAMLGPQPAIDL